MFGKCRSFSLKIFFKGKCSLGQFFPTKVFGPNFSYQTFFDQKFFSPKLVVEKTKNTV